MIGLSNSAWPYRKHTAVMGMTNGPETTKYLPFGENGAKVHL